MAHHEPPGQTPSASSPQPFAPTRAVIEDVIRELEFESLVRWASVIDKLRRV
jgi:hypothetical protein